MIVGRHRPDRRAAERPDRPPAGHGPQAPGRPAAAHRGHRRDGRDLRADLADRAHRRRRRAARGSRPWSRRRRRSGSVQIRNRASLTGNICNASPAADTAPRAARATTPCRARQQGGASDASRWPTSCSGPRRTDLRPGEIVTALELPEPEGHPGATFARLTRRRGVDLATLSLCCLVGPTRTRFAFGAVAPRRSSSTTTAGCSPTPARAPGPRARAARVTARARPISDLRAGADYRQAMLLVLSRRALGTPPTRLPPDERR